MSKKLNNSNSDLPAKIKNVLLLYLKTQFILVLITVSAVWGIMFAVPEIHPIYEALIAILSSVAPIARQNIERIINNSGV